MSAIEKLRVDHKLIPESMLCGEYGSLLSSIAVLAICNDGTGRSEVVARTLAEEHGISAAYLYGGLSKICSQDFECAKFGIINLINIFPYVAITLTRLEVAHYASTLGLITNRRQFQGSKEAVAGICKTLNR